MKKRDVETAKRSFFKLNKKSDWRCRENKSSLSFINKIDGIKIKYYPSTREVEFDLDFDMELSFPMLFNRVTPGRLGDASRLATEMLEVSYDFGSGWRYALRSRADLFISMGRLDGWVNCDVFDSIVSFAVEYLSCVEFSLDLFIRLIKSALTIREMEKSGDLFGLDNSLKSANFIVKVINSRPAD